MLEFNVDEDIRLVELNRSHACDIFNIINTNRDYFRKWLVFVDETHKPEDTEQYIELITSSANLPNGETIVSIFYSYNLVGLVSLKKVDWSNRIAEMSYWLDPVYQGKGIITRSCKPLIEYAFTVMEANRLEIKCGVGNEKSSHIAQRLGFTFEGIERDGEIVNGNYINLEVYSLLKREWHSEFRSNPTKTLHHHRSLQQNKETEFYL